MLRKLLHTVACSLVLSLAFARPTLAEDLAERMDRIVQTYVDSREFMGAVLVAEGDKVIFNKAYGSANLEWKIPNTTSTKFRIGSVTKQFTAVAALLLEERGKLRIDEPVKTYYPDAPPAWDKITLFHLLTHTAGIPNYTSFPDYPATQPLKATPEELIKRFRDRPLEFAPGEKMSYSNSGYVLLGAIIEKASGMTYAQFVQENIFKPFGMKNSGYDSATAIIPFRATGYGSGPDGPMNVRFLDMTVPFAAGGLYSTTEDLLRWEQALFGGKVLSEASFKKLTTPVKNNYAFGLKVRKQFGRDLIEHGGNINGFSSALFYYPDGKLIVIVLSNMNGRGPDIIAKKLGALVHGDAVAE